MFIFPEIETINYYNCSISTEFCQGHSLLRYCGQDVIVCHGKIFSGQCSENRSVGGAE